MSIFLHLKKPTPDYEVFEMPTQSHLWILSYQCFFIIFGLYTAAFVWATKIFLAEIFRNYSEFAAIIIFIAMNIPALIALMVQSSTAEHVEGKARLVLGSTYYLQFLILMVTGGYALMCLYNEQWYTTSFFVASIGLTTLIGGMTWLYGKLKHQMDFMISGGIAGVMMPIQIAIYAKVLSRFVEF